MIQSTKDTENTDESETINLKLRADPRLWLTRTYAHTNRLTSYIHG